MFVTKRKHREKLNDFLDDHQATLNLLLIEQQARKEAQSVLRVVTSFDTVRQKIDRRSQGALRARIDAALREPQSNVVR